MKDCGDSRDLGWNLWFLLLLGIVFSVSPETMLIVNATLRDILLDRMGMFSSSSILNILSDTLILRLSGFVLDRGITKSMIGFRA